MITFDTIGKANFLPSFLRCWFSAPSFSSGSIGHARSSVGDNNSPTVTTVGDLPIEMAASEGFFNIQHMGNYPLPSAFADKYAPLPLFAPEPV